MEMPIFSDLDLLQHLLSDEERCSLENLVGERRSRRGSERLLPPCVREDERALGCLNNVVVEGNLRKIRVR